MNLNLLAVLIYNFFILAGTAFLITQGWHPAWIILSMFLMASYETTKTKGA